MIARLAGAARQASGGSAVAPWIGRGGRRTVIHTALVSLARAASIVLFAEALTRAIVAVVEGTAVSGSAVALGVGAIALRATTEWALRMLGARGALQVSHELRLALLRRALTGGGDAGASTALLAGSRVDEVQEFFVRVVPSAVAAATVPVLIGARVLTLDLLSAVILLLTLPLVPIFMVLVGRHTQERTDRASRALNRLADHLVELAKGLPVLVGLGRLDDQLQALDEVSTVHRRATMATLRVAFLSALVLELIATISVAVVAVFIGVRLVAGELPLEVGLLVLILAPECFTPFREVGAAFHSSRAGSSALRDAGRLLAAAPAGSAPEVGPRGSGVRIDDLEVRYADRAVAAVRVRRGRIAPRATVAVSGPSGAGKSTLLAALVGRLPAAAAASGRIAIDHELTDGGVAWMPQQPTFAAPTVRDELTLHGTAGADAEERSADALVQVLERAALDPALLDADIAQLSPGERRRLAFARVLLRIDAGAALVVLDEPTAHLDDAAATAVLDELWLLRGSVTMVVASHDARVRALCGHELRLDEDAVPDAEPVPEPGARTSDAVTSAATRTPGAMRPSATPVDDEVLRGAVAAPHGTSTPAGEAPAISAPSLRDLLRGSRRRLLAGALLAAGAAAAGAALTALSGWLIVRAAEQPPILLLMVAIVGVRFFGIARSVLRYAERLAVHDAVLRLAQRLRARLWRRVAADGPAHRRLLRGESVIDALVVLPDTVRDAVPRVLVPPLAAAVTVGGALVAVRLIAPELLVPLATLLLGGLVLAPVAAVVADRSAAAGSVALRSVVVQRAGAVLSAADELVVHGLAERVVRSVEHSDRQVTRLARRSALAQGVGAAIGVAACLAAALLAPVLLGQGGDVAPALVAVLALLPLGLIEPILAAAEAVRQASALRAAASRLPLHGERQAAAAATPNAGPAPSAAAREGVRGVPAVSLDTVTARWPGATVDAVAAVSAAIGIGQRLAVTGPSGSGKSTLLAVVLGQLAPRSGRARVLGQDAAALLGRRPPAVAWCPQESHVFDASLRANLLLARDRDDAPGNDELHAVLRAVRLDGLVAALPQGLATGIGPGGARLSGGERQRLAMARALLSRAEVLLLDEPTAHLDDATAEGIRHDLAVAAERRAVILVSHDGRDLDGADRVVDLGVRVTPRAARAFAEPAGR